MEEIKLLLHDVMGADLQQRAVQERAAPGARELDAAADLGGVVPQLAGGEGDRAGAGAGGRTGRQPAAVHGHRLRHVPRLPRVRRRQEQDLPPVKEAASASCCCMRLASSCTMQSFRRRRCCLLIS